MQYAMTQPEIAYVVNGVAMKATIDVQDRADADRIKTALQDAQTHALITVLGALADLPLIAQRRILSYAQEHFDGVQHHPKET